MSASPPLSNIRVLEFAGLAPGPFAGKLLADYGASVLRIDRHDASPNQKTVDPLAEHKRSIRVNLKSADGVALVTKLAKTADVVIDPFRPGVLERLGLGPDILLKANPRLVFSRMAGFRRDGKYKDMAGHDINYIAVSGVLSLFGRAGDKPYAPGNIVGDFAGGGAICFLGILLALFSRVSSGRGQVVEANMVDGSAYMSLWPRLLMDQRSPMWSAPRGRNILDGGSPFYDTYKTKDGRYMAVGALEPAFYSTFIKLLLPEESDIPDRGDPKNWPALKSLITATFLRKPRQEWESIFDGTDACVTPVKTIKELRAEKFEQRAAVTLNETPARASHDWKAVSLAPGENGTLALEEWWGLKEGNDWSLSSNGHAVVSTEKSKL